MPKFKVEVSFNLGTTIEPEVSRHHWDTSGTSEFSDDSYFQSEEVTSSGGSLTFEIEDDGFEDEDDVKSWVESNVIADGNEVQDDNDLTWIVEDLDIEVEKLEMSIEEAATLLRSFLDSREPAFFEAHPTVAEALDVLLKHHDA